MTVRPMFGSRRARYPAANVLGALLLAGAVSAGCGGGGDSAQGSSTSCTLSQCTITFQRGVDPGVQILGVEARLVGVNGDRATLEVAGQQVQLRVNQQTQIGGFQVSLQKLTEQQAVVQIARGGQNGGGGGEGG